MNTIRNTDLKKRIIEISYAHKLSHLGSCLTAVDILAEIYEKKKLNEPFILSQGHAGLALYVVLEKYANQDAEALFIKHGVHPNRDPAHGIDCAAGSLGQGLPIALGMALADRSRNVYCLVSDGECAEGSIWESLYIKDRQQVENLKIYFNMNGYSAYDEVDTGMLAMRLSAFDAFMDFEINTSFEYDFPFLKGVNAHYLVMNEEQYQEALRMLV